MNSLYIKYFFKISRSSFLFIPALVAMCLNVNFMAKAQSLKIFPIANEGVLINVGKNKVVIDGIFKSTYPQFESTPEVFLNQMKNNGKLFKGIDVLLASHIHSDHFTSLEVSSVLEHLPKVYFYANQQIMDKLIEERENAKDLSKQTIVFEHGKPLSKTFDKIKINTFPIAHAGAEKTEWIQNTGHLIEIEGYKVLHVGDPYFGKEELLKANLTTQEIDVAILPYWFLNSEEGRAVVDSTINAKRYIANHIPIKLKEEIANLFKGNFKVSVLGQKGLLVRKER